MRGAQPAVPAAAGPPSIGNYFEAALAEAIGSHTRLDLNVYRRQSSNYADDDQLLNTGVSYPIAFRKAIIYGVERWCSSWDAARSRVMPATHTWLETRGFRLQAVCFWARMPGGPFASSVAFPRFPGSAKYRFDEVGLEVRAARKHSRRRGLRLRSSFDTGVRKLWPWQSMDRRS